MTFPTDANVAKWIPAPSSCQRGASRRARVRRPAGRSIPHGTIAGLPLNLASKGSESLAMCSVRSRDSQLSVYTLGGYDSRGQMRIRHILAKKCVEMQFPRIWRIYEVEIDTVDCPSSCQNWCGRPCLHTWRLRFPRSNENWCGRPCLKWEFVWAEIPTPFEVTIPEAEWEIVWAAVPTPFEVMILNGVEFRKIIGFSEHTGIA